MAMWRVHERVKAMAFEAAKLERARAERRQLLRARAAACERAAAQRRGRRRAGRAWRSTAGRLLCASHFLGMLSNNQPRESWPCEAEL